MALEMTLEELETYEASGPATADTLARLRAVKESTEARSRAMLSAFHQLDSLIDAAREIYEQVEPLQPLLYKVRQLNQALARINDVVSPGVE